MRRFRRFFRRYFGRGAAKVGMMAIHAIVRATNACSKRLASAPIARITSPIARAAVGHGLASGCAITTSSHDSPAASS
jgi:hypothetical protein